MRVNLFHDCFCKQKTSLDLKEPKHWVMHWNNIQICLNSGLVVREFKHMLQKSFHKIISWPNRRWYWRWRSEGVVWSIERKHGARALAQLVNGCGRNAEWPRFESPSGEVSYRKIARYGHLNSDPYAHTEAALFRTLDPPSEQNEDWRILSWWVLLERSADLGEVSTR